MIYRIYALTKKEFRQIRRDVRTLALIFIFPIFLLLLFGYAISFDVKHVLIAVLDEDNSETSRKFIQSLQSSEYFDLVAYLEDEGEINKFLDEKKAQCVIVIPNRMSENFISGEDAKIQFLIDGVDGNTASIIVNYVNAATNSFSAKLSQEILTRNGMKIFIPLNIEPLFWFNPELSTTKFLVPGLLSVILIIAAVILTCLSIVREKELGSIEQLNVSPLTPPELIIGKTIPYAVIALLVASFTLLLSYIFFDIEIKGSIILLFISTVLFLLAALSMGILISAIADSQQVAFQVASLATMLPTMVLSGFVFPIESMPVAIQIITNLTPAKFYIVILRALLIKGVGFSAVWEQMLYLSIFTVIFLSVATIRTLKTRIA